MNSEQIATFLTEDIQTNNGLILEHNIDSLIDVLDALKSRGNWYLRDLFPNKINRDDPNFLKILQKVADKYKALNIFPSRPYHSDKSMDRLMEIVSEIITKQKNVPNPSGPARVGGKWTDRSFSRSKV
jgi:hypothetical protein